MLTTAILLALENPGRSFSSGDSGLELSLRTGDQCTSHIGVYLTRRERTYSVSSSGTPLMPEEKSPLWELGTSCSS